MGPLEEFMPMLKTYPNGSYVISIKGSMDQVWINNFSVKKVKEKCGKYTLCWNRIEIQDIRRISLDMVWDGV